MARAKKALKIISGTMIVFTQMFEHTQKFIAFQPAELIEKTWAKLRVWSRELWSAPSWKPTWWPPIFFAFSDRKWIEKCLYQIWAKSYRFWKFIETAANLLKHGIKFCRFHNECTVNSMPNFVCYQCRIMAAQGHEACCSICSQGRYQTCGLVDPR